MTVIRAKADRVAKVFISYAREDAARVDLLERALQDHRVATWRDVSSLAASDRFPDRIEQELHAASAVLVCWSTQAAGKRWVKEEATVAERTGKYIGCLIAPGHPPLGFSTLQYFDLTSWNGDPGDPMLLRLLQPIGQLLGDRKIAGLLEARDLAEAEKREAQERKAAAEEAQKEWVRREEQIEQNAILRKKDLLRQKEIERRRTHSERAVRVLRRFYWFNPVAVAVASVLAGALTAAPIAEWPLSFLGTGLVGVALSLPPIYLLAALTWWIAIWPNKESLSRWTIGLVVVWMSVPGLNTAFQLCAAAAVVAVVTAWRRNR